MDINYRYQKLMILTHNKKNTFRTKKLTVQNQPNYQQKYCKNFDNTKILAVCALLALIILPLAFITIVNNFQKETVTLSSTNYVLKFSFGKNSKLPMTSKLETDRRLSSLQRVYTFFIRAVLRPIVLEVPLKTLKQLFCTARKLHFTTAARIEYFQTVAY